MSDDNGTACQFDGGAIQTGSGNGGDRNRSFAPLRPPGPRVRRSYVQNGGTVVTSASLVNGYPTVGPVLDFHLLSVPADGSSDWIHPLPPELLAARVVSNTEMQTV